MKVRWFRMPIPLAGDTYLEVNGREFDVVVEDIILPYPHASHKLAKLDRAAVKLTPVIIVHPANKQYLNTRDFRRMDYTWRRCILYLSNNPGLIFDPLWDKEVPLT